MKLVNLSFVAFECGVDLQVANHREEFHSWWLVDEKHEDLKRTVPRVRD